MTITDAPGIYVLELKAGSSVPTGGSSSLGGTVIEAPKGPVGVVTKIKASEMIAVFGTPFSKKAGTKMEGLRHLADALRETEVEVVRVVADDALYPALDFDDEGNFAAGTPESYGTTTVLGTGLIFRIYPVDGDPSTNRAVLISNVDDTNERFDITITDVNPKTGATYTLETFTVGISRDDIDDMGMSAFIETVFETQSEYFRVEFTDDAVTWATLSTLLAAASTAVTFTGGTNGGDPTAQNYIDAWQAHRNSDAQTLFAAGCYEATVLAECCDIAEQTKKTFVFDVPPGLKHVPAISWLETTGLESRQAAAYYNPFKANDLYDGGLAVWGASGEVCAAIARGDSGMARTDTPGVHQNPAGPTYGKLKRTGLKRVFPMDSLDLTALNDARINPIRPGANGGAEISDSLALVFKQNYTRFIHVNRIDNYIARQFISAVSEFRFSPDAVTRNGIAKVIELILSPLVRSGALVEPRDPEKDGTEPYVYTIEQRKFDLWHVEYRYCPTGVTRRIIGQPILMTGSSAGGQVLSGGSASSASGGEIWTMDVNEFWNSTVDDIWDNPV